jgi:hypothetical protein
MRVAVASMIYLALMFRQDRLTVGPSGVQGWSRIFALGPLRGS